MCVLLLIIAIKKSKYKLKCTYLIITQAVNAILFVISYWVIQNVFHKYVSDGHSRLAGFLGIINNIKANYGENFIESTILLIVFICLIVFIINNIRIQKSYFNFKSNNTLLNSKYLFIYFAILSVVLGLFCMGLIHGFRLKYFMPSLIFITFAFPMIFSNIKKIKYIFSTVSLIVSIVFIALTAHSFQNPFVIQKSDYPTCFVNWAKAQKKPVYALSDWFVGGSLDTYSNNINLTRVASSFDRQWVNKDVYNNKEFHYYVLGNNNSAAQTRIDNSAIDGKLFDVNYKQIKFTDMAVVKQCPYYNILYSKIPISL
jgi:hypothetical protein